MNTIRDKPFAFSASTALQMLDDIIDHPETLVIADVGAAWEAAWLACFTNNPKWTDTAREEMVRLIANGSTQLSA